MLDWWTRNRVPPCPDPAGRSKLSGWVREWHPDFDVGDFVYRQFGISAIGPGIVRRFDWSGAHLIAYVEFEQRVEHFVANEYTRLLKGRIP